jgi:hypothetical protein
VKYASDTPFFSGQMNVNEQASVAIRTAWSIFAILAIGKQQLR